jgi:hypothetical protein
MEDDEDAVSEVINDPTETNSDSETPEKATSQNEAKDTTPKFSTQTLTRQTMGRRKRKSPLKRKMKWKFSYYPLDEVAYMKIPPGFEIENTVFRIKKALYRLRRSPLLWQIELLFFLTLYSAIRKGCGCGQRSN